ncbi:hypothetical protein KIMH_13820 [Bombiscardovia apis]|uniref:HTH tetR-type domain-containing protein n=1 Tax=Bombiscardovia apis TaxID=2932182 RepID=A0ABN6SH05_9BIFI|nr:hypothetical protein KIMH_13820 [Bombiscardovia apis]
MLKQARAVFWAHGYEGSSVDDLVEATGLLRGSLYSTFGSKRGIFLAVLRTSLLPGETSSESLGMALVAMMELSASDHEVHALLTDYLVSLPESEQPAAVARLLGQQLLERADLQAVGAAKLNTERNDVSETPAVTAKRYGEHAHVSKTANQQTIQPLESSTKL